MGGIYDQKHQKESLDEIRSFANERNSDLMRLGVTELDRGGCLILGNCYAKAPHIFCGLNPGGEGDGFYTDPCSVAPWNSPFRNDPEEENSTGPYWRNCQKFMQAHYDLNRWFNKDVTSTFLIPWRTRKGLDLWDLNRKTNGKLFHYSGEILNKMIDHHRAELLVIAGKGSIDTLRAILSKFRDTDISKPEQFYGPGRTYQWSEARMTKRGRKVSVLQIPHFSRANSLPKMAGCAAWLRPKLIPYGLRNGK